MASVASEAEDTLVAEVDGTNAATGGSLTAHLVPERDEQHWLKAKTLRNLRWIAIAGQFLTIIVTHYFLGFELPLTACIAAIMASVWFNFIASITMPANARLSERAALSWLLYDMAQLAFLLALTGGVSNPFALLFIAPTTVAAAALSIVSARVVIAFALLMILALELWHFPLHYENGEIFELPLTYRYGVGCALAVGVAFIAIYVRRVADEAFGMSRALAATQLALAREQRLSSLGAMAAAAAHELGTPLATIALTAREMERDLDLPPPHSDDLQLIREQTGRCREILAQLALTRRDTEHVTRAPLLSVLEEAAGPYEHSGKRVEYFVDGERVEDSAVMTPIVERRPETIHALRNLVQNAVDFAESEVWIELTQSPERIAIRIQDDGPGFKPDVLSRLGDPFVTSRRGRRAREGGYEGMGLGLFIAKTLLERCGASLVFANQRESATTLPGASIEISWRAADFEKLIGIRS